MKSFLLLLTLLLSSTVFVNGSETQYQCDPSSICCQSENASCCETGCNVKDVIPQNSDSCCKEISGCCTDSCCKKENDKAEANKSAGKEAAKGCC